MIQLVKIIDYYINKATYTRCLIKCKRYHFANVLSSPPHSLTIKHNNYEKASNFSILENDLTNEQQKAFSRIC